jgi:hypothetical protein
LPGIPWYGVTILAMGVVGWATRMVARSGSSARATISWVPSVEPPSEVTITPFASGKYLVSPAAAARTTWPMVRALV